MPDPGLHAGLRWVCTQTSKGREVWPRSYSTEEGFCVIEWFPIHAAHCTGPNSRERRAVRNESRFFYGAPSRLLNSLQSQALNPTLVLVTTVWTVCLLSLAGQGFQTVNPDKVHCEAREWCRSTVLVNSGGKYRTWKLLDGTYVPLGIK